MSFRPVPTNISVGEIDGFQRNVHVPYDRSCFYTIIFFNSTIIQFADGNPPLVKSPYKSKFLYHHLLFRLFEISFKLA